MPNQDIARAQDRFADLVRWEAHGWGDAGNAMRRIATRTSIPFGKLWALKYRPPKEIASHILARLEAAHAAERERQLRKLADEVTLTARVAGSDHAAVRAAEALLRAAERVPVEPGSDVAPAPVGPAARRPRRPAASELTELPLFGAMELRP